MEPAPGRGRRAVVVDPHASLAGGRPAAVVESTREIPVQVNGKLRDKVVVAADASAADIEARSSRASGSATILDGRAPDRIVVAGGGKLVNLVVR